MPRRNSSSRRRRSGRSEPSWTETNPTTEQLAVRLVLAGRAPLAILHGAPPQTTSRVARLLHSGETDR